MGEQLTNLHKASGHQANGVAAATAGVDTADPGTTTGAMRPLSVWERWMRRPHKMWVRRALFQVHLWVGIAAGLYILMISITGSAIVYRPQISRRYQRKPVVLEPAASRMSESELRQRAAQLYPKYDVADYFEAKKPTDPVAIVLRNDSAHMQRLFNPYTGADLGDPLSPAVRAMEWLSDLHDNLLGGKKGRAVNGVGAICCTVLALTGAIIWWPGIYSWRRGLTIKWDAKFARWNYDVHSAVGFWLLLFVFMWGVTGIYLSFETPVYALFNWLDPNDNYTDTFLQQFEFLHFGRYNAFWEGVWVVLGLVPAVLFVTGAVMWWKRVLSKGPRWPD
jgi:uncharacterized iron-regulated membrane protein